MDFPGYDHSTNDMNSDIFTALKMLGVTVSLTGIRVLVAPIGSYQAASSRWGIPGTSVIGRLSEYKWSGRSGRNFQHSNSILYYAYLDISK